jgi:alpha-mannosidase
MARRILAASRAAAVLSMAAAAAAAQAPRDALWVLPHTHWEGAVFYTREEYLETGFPHIVHALQLLERYPDYTFVLDQVAYVRPFLERFPEHAPAFRKFVAQGRLELVLGMDVMPDDNRPGGETLIRQIQYGKGWYRKEFGVDVTVGWLLDTFGHHAQMPQILKLGGYRSFWFFRGVPSPDHPTEFLWEGIDGTRIPAVWLPHGYGMFWGAPDRLPEFEEFARRHFASLESRSRGHDRAAPCGVDVCDPEEPLPAVMELHARSGHDLGFDLRFGVPSRFDALVAARIDLPAWKGELNPIFQGTYSSRIELKQKGRELERLFDGVEKLGAIGALLAPPQDDARLWTAWELLLFNQTHDLASGVMTDHVYDDVVSELDHARRLGEELEREELARLASAIDTRGPGVALIVFNPSGWPRDDVATATIGFTEPGLRSVAVVDAAGAKLPVEIEAAVRGADGSLREATIAFLAHDVPALGFTVCHATGSAAEDPAEFATTDATAGVAALDNERLHAEFDRATGALTRLQSKEAGGELLRGPANVVSREDDHGDLWETYQPLDGGSRIAVQKRQAVPTAGPTTRLSSEFRGAPGCVRIGPLFSEFTVAHPFDGGEFATTARLVRGARRLEFTTRLLNRSKEVRYQVQFPIAIAGGRNFQSIPFGAIERPFDVEYPAQDWIDLGDGERGVALLNIGMPGNLVASDGTMLLSLLRAETLRGYTEGGGTSDRGLELDVPRTLRYALAPHHGDWRDAAVFRDAAEFARPLVCVKAAAHEGPLGTSFGLLTISSRNVVLSALQAGRDGALSVRVFEATGRAATGVALTVATKILDAAVTNLMGDPIAPLAPPTQNGTCVSFDLGPFEIKTLRLRLAPPAPAAPSSR